MAVAEFYACNSQIWDDTCDMHSKDVPKGEPEKNEALMRALRRHRMAQGMSLKAMAGKLKVATSTAQAWESGRNLPRPEIIPKLARVLAVDPLELTRLMSPEPVASH